VIVRVILGVLTSGVVLAGCGAPPPDESEANAPAQAVENVAEATSDEAPVPASYEKQIVSTAELMKLLVDPIYEELKDAIETPPDGRNEWRALYIAAFNLAEVNNLLFSRSDEDYQATPEWIEESLEAQELGITLAESIRAQSEYETIKDNYLAVMRNCNDCHRTFEPGEIDEITPPLSWDIEVEKDPAAFEFQ